MRKLFSLKYIAPVLVLAFAIAKWQHPFVLRAQEIILNPSATPTEYMKPQAPESVVSIILKAKETALVAKAEKEQSAEFDKKFDKVLNGRVLEKVISGEKSTAERITENKIKYPQRAARAPKNAVTPRLLLLRRIPNIPRADAEKIITNLRNNPLIEYATIEPDQFPTAITAEPDDPLYTIQRSFSNGSFPESWALRQIGLNPTGDGNFDSGWDNYQGNHNTTVAVYGTGLDYTHPDLKNNVWVNPGEDINHNGLVWDTADMNGADDDNNGYTDDLIGWNFSANNNNPYDDGSAYGGHDTQVASIIGAAGNNDNGISGINWNINIMGIKYGGYEQVIRYATDNGADVVNISWTGYGTGLKDIVDYAYANGTIVIFSSANNGTELPYNDSISDHTWIIGATTYYDSRPGWSNYGNRLDFSAPGTAVSTALPTNIKTWGPPSSPFGFQPIATAIDSNGKIAMAIFDPETNSIKYSIIDDNNPGLAWEIVESGNWAGVHTSLAFDQQNNPHIAYYDWIDRKLKYAYKTTGAMPNNWQIKTLTETGDQGFYPSIKIGADDKIRIVFTDTTQLLIKMITLDGDIKTEESVASVGASSYGRQLSFTIDDGNVPHIAFCQNSTSDLVHAAKINSEWQTNVIDTGGNMSCFPAIAIDRQNIAHIAYAKNNGTWTFRHAWTDNEGIWQNETIRDTCTGIENAIAIDQDGKIHTSTIAYDGYTRILYYYKNPEENWARGQDIGTTGQPMGFIQNLLLKNNDPVVIAESRNRGIYLAKKGATGSAWQLSQIIDWGFPYSQLGGTSAAAPMASGLAALMISRHPDWNLDQIYWAIATSVADVGDPGFDKYFGWGRIDAKRAMDIQTPLIDTISPTAEITSPTNGQIVSPGTINVVGTANDDNFTYYDLLYRQAGTNYWNAVSWRNHLSKTNGALGSVDILNPGNYEMKLIAHDWYQETATTIQFTIGSTKTIE